MACTRVYLTHYVARETGIDEQIGEQPPSLQKKFTFFNYSTAAYKYFFPLAVIPKILIFYHPGY